MGHIVVKDATVINMYNSLLHDEEYTQTVLHWKILMINAEYLKLAAVTNMDYGYGGLTVFFSNFRYEIGMKNDTIIFHRNNVESCSEILQ